MSQPAAMNDAFVSSYTTLIVATKTRGRYWDGDAVRTPHKPESIARFADPDASPSRGRMNRGNPGHHIEVDERMKQNPNGAPLLDWWAIPEDDTFVPRKEVEMGSARYIVGDVFDVLATLEPGSVDLVVSSPPFLALRSYLPSDHESKHLEIGSEATPGEFIDRMLDVVEACARVLAPHGSLVVELGDTYSGSTGAGGDYQIREVSPGERATRRESFVADGVIPNTMRRIGPGWPLDKSKVLIPQLFAIALAYGFNPLTGRETEPWRVRNVIAWCRPNPPVGRDGDKFRPATSFLTIACKARDRYWDGDAVRVPFKAGENGGRAGSGEHDGPEHDGDAYRRRAANLSERVMTHAGAPLLDWWQIPTQPYKGSHYATFPAALVVPVVKSMCPRAVCPRCGPIYPLESVHDAASMRAMRGADHDSISDTGARSQAPVLFEELCLDSTLGGEASRNGGSWVPSQEPAIRLRGDPLAGAPDGEQVGSGVRAPGGDGRALGTNADRGRSGAPQERGAERQPHRESRVDDPAGPSEGTDPAVEAAPPSSLRGACAGGEPCPACGAITRSGVVLDPFAGSGTTLQVATGHGLDAIGIDLDERNAELAVERIGGLFLTVERFAFPIGEVS